MGEFKKWQFIQDLLIVTIGVSISSINTTERSLPS